MILGHHPYCAKLSIQTDEIEGYAIDEDVACTCGIERGTTGLRCISCKRELAQGQLVLVARFHRVVLRPTIDAFAPGGFGLLLTDDYPVEAYGICSSQCLMDMHRDVLGDGFLAPTTRPLAPAPSPPAGTVAAGLRARAARPSLFRIRQPRPGADRANHPPGNHRPLAIQPRCRPT